MVAEVVSRAGGQPDVRAAGASGRGDAGEGFDDGARRLYLTCVVGGETYLVPAGSIREVEEVRGITPVPNTPGWLLGVMNLRGSIVGVADLGRFLGLAGLYRAPGDAALVGVLDLDGVLRALEGLAGERSEK